MKNMKIVGFILAVGALALLAADYTVPKTWSVTGAEYASRAMLHFNPQYTNTPSQIQVFVWQKNPQTLRMEEGMQSWTLDSLQRLPDTIVVNGNTVTNLFKLQMTLAFSRFNIVAAYNWALVDGREASMVPQ